MDNLDLINSLNEEQRAPVLQTEGAVLVTAGAGSGKTRVLTHRIAYLIQNGVHPYNILAITFTNKAAAEMRERVEKITYDCQDMWVCTFHSMCVRILRQFADKLGYTKNFSIYGEQERESIVKQIMQSFNIDEDQKKTMTYHIGNAKNLNLTPLQYRTEFGYLRDIDNIYKVYDNYQIELKKNNAFDFDDLLNKTYELLETNAEAREKFQDRFHYIHIDEFQDTNRVQYDIAKILSQKYGNIMVVGDEDQCIYGWRGANIQNIFDFKEDFKDVKIYKLEQNYRCTKNIIDVANAVIKHNEQRLDKVLYTNNDEGDSVELFVGYNDVQEANFISRRVKELVDSGFEYKDIAVLMRYNALSRSIEEGLLNANIPYKVLGGMKFYERAEIKNVLAYLKVLVNNQDNESLLRIINFPRRGIGSTSINNIRALADAQNMSIFQYLKDYAEFLPTNIKNKVIPFRDLIIELTSIQNTKPLLDVVKDVITKTKMREAYMEKNTTEDENRILNIDSLLASVDAYAKTYPDDSLAEYLQSITLLSDADEQDDSQNSVVLATVHAVKGLEFKAVFVVGLEDENFPIIRDNGQDDIEEERRLFYVAVTRAKQKLYLTYCQNRFKFGQIKRFMPSRFLDELNGLKNIKRVSFNRGYNLDNANTQNSFSSNYQSTYSYQNNFDNGNQFNYSQGFNIANNEINKPTVQTTAFSFESKSTDGFVVGAKVEHPRFGVGVIVDTTKLNSANVISVDFEDVGVKNLTFDVSPLTLI